MRYLTGPCLAVLLALSWFADASEGAASTFATYGASFAGPAGWRQALLTERGGIATWVSFASGGHGVETIVRRISVYGFQLKQGTDPREYVGALAKDIGGSVLDATTTLDGERAWRVRVEKPIDKMQCVEGIVVVHAGWTYFIDGTVAPGLACRDEVEAIRASWKWVPFEPQEKHFEFWEDRLPLLGGTIQVTFPKSMFAEAVVEPNPKLSLSLFDLRANDLVFSVDLQLVPEGKGKALLSLRDAIAKAAAVRFGSAETPKWQELKAPGKRAMTNSVRATKAIEKVGEYRMGIGVIQLEDDRELLVNYLIFSAAGPDWEKYEAVVQQIMESTAVEKVAPSGK